MPLSAEGTKPTSAEGAKPPSAEEARPQSPWRIGRAAWWQVLKGVWRESSADNVGLIAAGAAFYGFLSIVPALGAMLLMFGLFASPDTLVQSLVAISEKLPPEAAKLVGEQIIALVSAPSSNKGFGVAGAIALAIYGATKGVDGLVTALTIAFDGKETRGWLRRQLTVIGLTLFTVVFALVSLGAVSALSLPAALMPVPFDTAWVLAVTSTVVLTAAGIFAASVFYRFGPAERTLREGWLSPGAVFTAVAWFLVTSGFAWYTSSFGNYNATWGALAGIVVLLTWLYLSAYVLLVGAELDAELECRMGKRKPP